MAAVYSGATTMREQFSEWYLDYRNNFTSVLVLPIITELLSIKPIK